MNVFYFFLCFTFKTEIEKHAYCWLLSVVVCLNEIVECDSVFCFIFILCFFGYMCFVCLCVLFFACLYFSYVFFSFFFFFFFFFVICCVLLCVSLNVFGTFFYIGRTPLSTPMEKMRPKRQDVCVLTTFSWISLCLYYYLKSYKKN